MTTQTHQPRSLSLNRLFVVAEATALALFVWAAGWLFDVPFTVRSGGSDQTIGATSVTFVAVVAGLAGWASLAACERFVPRPQRVWSIVALAVLALSLLGPLGSAVGASTTVALLCLHLAVGGVLVVGLRRQSSR